MYILGTISRVSKSWERVSRSWEQVRKSRSMLLTRGNELRMSWRRVTYAVGMSYSVATT